MKVMMVQRTLLFLLTLLIGSHAVGEDAHLETYTAEDGQRYFTLSLQGDSQAKPAPRDVVIVVDTSASQAGYYRETAIAAVKQCLAGLGEQDRVRIVAADLTTRVLNEAFVSPASADVEAAIAAVMQEPPLGSTDMELALQTSSELFDAESKAPRTILYVGDGMSPVNLVQAEQFAAMTEDLRNKRIVVTSYAVGPECDVRLLAALGNQTGGNVYVDATMVWPNEEAEITADRALAENRRRGRTVGDMLAEWVHGDVTYLAEARLPDVVAEIYPAQLPPLRSDRDTVVVGKLAGDADRFEIVATAGGEQLRWTATERDASHDLSYLPQLAEAAAKDGGITLPTLGTAGLIETGRMLLANVDHLTDLAERAVAIGDNEGAAQIVQTVLRRDPGNVRARTVQRLVERNAQGGEPAGMEENPAAQAPQTDNQSPAPANDPGELSLVRPQREVMSADDALRIAQRSLNTIEGEPAADIVRDGSFLTETERRNRVFAEMLQKDVENAISDARDQMRSDPEGAEQNLKLMLEGVRQAPELIAEVRAQLIDRLQTVIRETSLAARVKADVDRETEERLAQSRERQLLNDRLARREEHEKQLVARFNALMDERRYDEAVEVAAIVEEVDPLGTVPVSTELWSRFQRAHHLQMVTRELRHRAAFETWFQNELSSIPFPDEPPIVYPPAAEWIDLTKRREKYKAVDLKSQGGAEEQINSALAAPLTNIGLAFTETPLSEVVEFLRNEYQIEVQLDTQALDDLGLSPDDTITINLRNISLRSALKLTLKQHDLTYIIADEVLLITSEDEALSRLSVKVYPVADLVLPIETPQIGGGMMGGGMGGGMMGGGGGGMGGGMMGGGMGGGMMGGGGGGAFAVPEDTRDASAPAETAAAEKPAPAKTAKPQAARIKVDPSVSPELFWDGYFGSGQKDQAQVRAEVRRLMSDGEYANVSTLIQAALRHGQPQGWMYESLGIAMQLEGRSKAEVERALLSAADFARSADELCYLAMYLSRSGFDGRALQLYKQVVKIDPSRHEAYPMALRAAERADDLEGLKWATLGILEQGWPAEQAVVQETAVRHAKAIVERLVKEGRQEEAVAYRDAMVEALERDCIIRVSWTGDADVDLSVEEPSGTVCSPTNPRTPAGGINLGDELAQETKQQQGVYTETYVLPRGFDGIYRAKIESAWGKVTAGKVTVDVYLHYMSDKSEHQRHQLVLAQDGVGFEFSLDNGRRNELIEEQVIARALKRQEAISNAVLAQQLAGISDPRVAPLRDAARRGLNRRLLGGQGAVGFQPVIITLPEGTNFMATGVVSADRRYVRITSVPFFSTIGDVSTFTFAGAAQNDDDANGGDDGDDGDNGAG